MNRSPKEDCRLAVSKVTAPPHWRLEPSALIESNLNLLDELEAVVYRFFADHLKSISFSILCLY